VLDPKSGEGARLLLVERRIDRADAVRARPWRTAGLRLRADRVAILDLHPALRLLDAHAIGAGIKSILRELAFVILDPRDLFPGQLRASLGQ
jgi:hypothetical protein